MTTAARVLVVAEAGVNHGGDLGTGLALVDAAADAGADVVKFQTFSAARLATATAGQAPYQRAAMAGEMSQREMLAALELSVEDHVALAEHCSARGIEFCSTGFDVEDVDLLVDLGVRRLKVPSGELTDLPLLRHVGRQGLPILLSTGMADLDEVRAAVDALEAAGAARAEITVLHCTSAYPAPVEDANLAALATLRDALGVAVGYSDHTAGIEVAVAAVALGATVVEKHLTLDRSASGPDHAASIEAEAFAQMTRMIRSVETALGDGVKAPRPSELAVRAVARRSLVARTPIAAGEVFTADNVAAKRPSGGLSPMAWDDVIGRTAPRALEADEMIEP